MSSIPSIKSSEDPREPIDLSSKRQTSFQSLPDEMIIDILNKLPVIDLKNVSETSRKFLDISSDDSLWSPFLKRHCDFEGAMPTKRYKSAYKDYCVDITNLIKSFPRSDELLSKLKNDDFSSDSLTENLDDYLKILSESEFEVVLNKICEKASINFIKIFLKSDKVISRPALFNKFFVKAASANKADIIIEMMQDSRFANLPSQWGDSLESVFFNASRKGHIEVLIALMNNPRFLEIPIQSVFGLETAFYNAALNGRLDAMRLIMDNPRFSEISADGLTKAFSFAAQNRHPDAIKLMMNNSRFLEIPEEIRDRYSII